MADHPSPLQRPSRSPHANTSGPPPTADNGSRSESRSMITAGAPPRPSMAEGQSRQEGVNSESVRVASIAAAVAAAPVAAGVVMQMWQHLISFNAQIQQQQMQQQPQQAYNGPSDSVPPSPLPFTPAGVPFTPAGATSGVMSYPATTATRRGGGFDRGGATMTLPSGLPFSVDPWTWQRPQQHQPAAAQATEGGSSLKATSSGSIQYFGGAGGEVYCCIQGRWFQVKPAGQATVAVEEDIDPVIRSVDLTDPVISCTSI